MSRMFGKTNYLHTPVGIRSTNLSEVKQQIQYLSEINTSNRELLLQLFCEQNRLTRCLMPETKPYSPKVSVIMPVYNANPYLRQCLDSIRMQTLWNFELICVDDGSTDGSADILESYAKSDPRIKVIHQEKSNAGVARNSGMKEAAGEYLMFLDADDFFEPVLFLHLYETCVVSDADMSLYSGDRYNNTTGQFKPAPWFLNTHLVPSHHPFSWRDCPDRIFQLTTPAPYTKMFKRSFIEKTGLQFQSIKRTNDLFFVYSALALAERIAVCNEPLLHYRVNLQNSLQSGNSQTPLEFYKALSALQLKLKEEGIYPELERSFSNMALGTVMYHIETLRTSPETAKKITEAFFNQYVRQFDIEGKPRECFTSFRYRQYEQLLSERNQGSKIG